MIKTMANQFFLLGIGPNLTSAILGLKGFGSFISDINKIIGKFELIEYVLVSNRCLSLKGSEAPGFDEMYVTMMKSVFHHIQIPLRIF